MGRCSAAFVRRAGTRVPPCAGRGPQVLRAAATRRRGPVLEGAEAALARRLAAAFGETDATAAAAAAEREGEGSPRSVRGWSALLTLYAMADQSEEFLGSAPEALRAGVAVDVVLDLVRLFPPARRADVLQRLLAGAPDVAWPAGRGRRRLHRGRRHRARADLAVRRPRTRAAPVADRPAGAHRSRARRGAARPPGRRPRLGHRPARAGRRRIHQGRDTGAGRRRSSRPRSARIRSTAACSNGSGSSRRRRRSPTRGS